MFLPTEIWTWKKDGDHTRPLLIFLSHFLLSTIPQAKRHKLWPFSFLSWHPLATPGQLHDLVSPHHGRNSSIQPCLALDNYDTMNLESPFCFNKSWLSRLHRLMTKSFWDTTNWILALFFLFFNHLYKNSKFLGNMLFGCPWKISTSSV